MKVETEANRSRRDFIRTFSMLAGTGIIASNLPWLQSLHAQAGATGSPADRVRIGIIGPGSRGQYLMEYLKLIPDCEIAAICDDYAPNLQQGLNMVGGKVKSFTDYRQMLGMKDLDAILITTPLNCHAVMTMDALSAGKQVFCEKSMAMTMDDCHKMVMAQQSSGKILQIGHQRLFDIRYIKGIDYIKQGRIGKVTQMRAFWHRNNDWRRPVPSNELEKRINWRLYRDRSCGLMTELASHQVQVANWVLNAVPESVIGAGSINYWQDGREVFDNVNLVYTYPGGVHLIYDSLTSNKKYGFEEQIEGDRGTIEFEAGKIFTENPPPAPGILQLINQVEHKVFDVVPIGGPSWIPDSPSRYNGEYLIDKVLNSDGSDMEMEAFIAAVRNGKPAPGLLEQAYFASVAALMGDQAMITGKRVNWPAQFKI